MANWISNNASGAAMTELERAAKALMDSVNFDTNWNGGLISVKTQRCSDELRQVLLHLENQRTHKDTRT
jgi:hypothetical protein